MTRTARRGSKSRSLAATPWAYLKRRFKSRYQTLEDCELDADVEHHDPVPVETITSDDSLVLEEPETCNTVEKSKSDLKETRKTKLGGSSLKRFLQKIKQKISSRKLRRQLRQAEEETACLVEEPITSSKVRKKLFCSKKRRPKRLKEEKEEGEVRLLEEPESSNEEDDDDDSEEVETNDVRSFSKSRDTRRLPWKRGKLKKREDFDDIVVDEKRMKRNEARRLRRQKRKICFNCRQFGHMVQSCPLSGFSEAGICFKCGAADHTSKNCKTKVGSSEYPYAKCFICNEIGHLSRSCPHNPRGIYPQGGGCKVCGSVEHLKANCPQRLSNRDTQYESLGLTGLVFKNDSVDAEDYSMEITPSSSRVVEKKHKQSHTVVHF